MKKAGIALMVVVCVILLAAAVHLVMTEDRTAPEIIFSEDRIHYTQGDDESVLLAGVTAMDQKDGDVSASLVIDGIYPDDEGTTANVTYVARDSQNNIAKASRVVDYTSNAAGTVSDDTQADIDTAEQDEDDQSEEDNQDETIPVSGGVGSVTDNEDMEDLPEGSPRITLTTDAIVVKRGESVNRLSYVESITDDKDEKNTLWQRISIEGDTLDTSTAGVYELRYYVIDTDGNRSNIAVLTVTVQ